MMRIGYRPDDARGPLFVISFEDRDDLIKFKGTAAMLWDVAQEITLHTTMGSKIFDFDNVVFERAEKSRITCNQGATIALDMPTLIDLVEKLETLSGCKPGHNYVNIGDAELLITFNEYNEDRFFDGHPY